MIFLHLLLLLLLYKAHQRIPASKYAQSVYTLSLSSLWSSSFSWGRWQWLRTSWRRGTEMRHLQISVALHSSWWRLTIIRITLLQVSLVLLCFSDSTTTSPPTNSDVGSPQLWTLQRRPVMRFHSSTSGTVAGGYEKKRICWRYAAAALIWADTSG